MTMKKETYTPGSHHVNVAFSGNYVMAEDKITAICLCHRLEDAVLHAAALDLLKAAEAVREWAREQRIGIPVRCGLDSAIAKAKLEVV